MSIHSMPDIVELEAVRALISPHLHRSPTVRSQYLSDKTGYEVYLKLEVFQRTGSFKPRGMLARILSSTPDERRNGAITFSAGNAAQGLAYAGAIANVPTTVIMPAHASPIKAEATRGYGARVELHGTPAEAYARCMELVQREDLLMVSSFDDDMLMRGHASMGLEILEEVPEVEAIIAGIGGGGLIAGIAMATSAAGRDVRLIGVEPAGAAGMTLSLSRGKPSRLEGVSTMADGLGAPFAGELCYPIIRDYVGQVAVISDPEIIDAVKLLLMRCKILAEGAGASSVAALLSNEVVLPKGTRVCCVVSGGNIDASKLKEWL